MNKETLKWECVASQPFDENTYILYAEDKKECLVLDPGFEPDKIVEALKSLELTPVAILNTHGHSDHIAGNASMKELWPAAPLVIGHGDAYKLTDPHGNLSANYGMELISPPADETLKHDDVYENAGLSFKIWETPGHSAGHIVFVFESASQPAVVVGGDVLFRGGVGRSDFPDGDAAALERSIRMIYTLPDDTIVLPGHGPPTTVGFEKVNNPFVRAE